MVAASTTTFSIVRGLHDGLRKYLTNIFCIFHHVFLFFIHLLFCYYLLLWIMNSYYRILNFSFHLFYSLIIMRLLLFLSLSWLLVLIISSTSSSFKRIVKIIIIIILTFTVIAANGFSSSIKNLKEFFRSGDYYVILLIPSSLFILHLDIYPFDFIVLCWIYSNLLCFVFFSLFYFPFFTLFSYLLLYFDLYHNATNNFNSRLFFVLFATISFDLFSCSSPLLLAFYNIHLLNFPPFFSSFLPISSL